MTYVQGLDEFRRKWLAIPAAIQSEIAKEFEAIAESIVQDMRRVAPKDTGALAASIGWTWGTAPRGSLIIGTVGNPRESRLSITIFAGDEDTLREQNRNSGSRKRDWKRRGTFEVSYARFVEFGTLNAPASPFFFPVWRARRKSVKGRITRAINKAVRKVVT